MQANDAVFYLKRAAQGIFVSLFLITALFVPHRGEIVGQMLLYETMPDYKIESEMKEFLGLVPRADAIAVFLAGQHPDDSITEGGYQLENAADNLEADAIIALPHGVSDLIGLGYDIYQPEEKSVPVEHTYSEAPTEADLGSVKGLEELKHGFYTVDRQTNMTSADFSLDEFMKADLKIDLNGPGPKVLIFHTHSQEMFADSKDLSEGVLGLGGALCNILEEKYGISTLHDANQYDVLDGSSQILGAYERMEPRVRKILAEHPTIELVIDLHRDGVQENRRLVTNINGKPTAQIMFVNGLSKIYRNGTLMAIDSLSNPNRKTGLALSFRAQLEGNKQYPGLMRKIYLNAYRYSLHMLPKSMLIEVGAQTNTKEEAWNALEPLADILAATILK